MRGLIKKGLLYTGLATVCSISVGGCLTRANQEWINDEIEKRITKYEQSDKEWTKKKILAELRLSEHINEQKYETRVPLEQLVEAFASTYKVYNKAYYETREGNVLYAGAGLGSGILLKGGYLLTAKHVADEDFMPSYSDYYWGLVTYHHNRLSVGDTELELEKVIFGEYHDYALLKIKDGKDLPFYDKGFNLPDAVTPGMRSAAIGFPLGLNRNIRLGNLSQLDANGLEDHLTFKNSIIPGDSGGPLFVIEDGYIKFVAISTRLSVMRDWNVSGVRHPTNIGYGLKVEAILKDMEEKLASEELDEETAKEIENFLELNK